jgi:hypothetical protein
MRKFQLGLLACTVTAVGLILSGCGGPAKDRLKEVGDDYGKSGETKGDSSTQGKEKQPIKVTESGVIKGVIKLDGQRPNDLLAKLTKDLQGSMTTNKDYCMMGGPHEIAQQMYRIGDNNQVGNVFVWIEPASKNEYFEISDDVVKALPKEVVVRQPHCAFIPHCSVIFSRRIVKGKMEKTGQQLQIKNDATVAHNSKFQGGPRNPGGNPLLEPGKSVDADVVPENEPLSLTCSIHPFMQAYVRAFVHPYATVSLAADDDKDAKFGTYEIKGVPVGASVRLIAWHEKAGFLGDGDKGKTIKLEKENPHDFTMSVK